MKSVVALAFVFTAIVAAQTKPKDVDGWGKIKWGMTVAQAKTAYGDQAQASDGTGGRSTRYVEKLKITNFAVGDIKMKVSIETLPDSSLIREVSLALADEPQSSTRGSA